MKKILLYIYIAAITVATTLLTGCIDDPLLDDPTEESAGAGDVVVPGEEGSVYVRLFLQLPSDGRSRADGEPDRAKATSAENRITSLDVLVFDKETDKIIDIFTLKKGDEALAGGNFTDGQLTIPLFARVERPLTIRIVVNAPESMRHNMLLDRTSADIRLKAPGKTYRETINAFIPGSDGMQEKLENITDGCLPMTATFADSNNNTTITFPKGEHITPGTALDIHANLERMVAKMHVTAKYYKSTHISNMYYVIATDPTVKSKRLERGKPAENVIPQDIDNGYEQASPDWLGWIRVNDVRYIPNATNKSTYLFPQPNNAAADSRLCDMRDPNMNLDIYGLGGQATDTGDDPWDADFVHYNGVALQNDIISAEGEMSHIELYLNDRHDNTYDPTRYNGTPSEAGCAPEDDKSPYSRGMYCLENYFDKPANDLAGRKEAIPMVTHLSIAAKLTPRWIVVKDNFADLADEFFADAASPGGLEEDKFLEKYNFPKSSATENYDYEYNLWKDMRDRLYYYRLYYDDHKYRTNFRILATDNEEHAKLIIDLSLKGNRLWTPNNNEFQDGRFPSGTFYVFKYTDDPNYINNPEKAIQPSPLYKQQYLYLTAGVVAEAQGDDIALKLYSVPHIGGWGYYYTYLDGLGEHNSASPMPYTASQVARNTYYLITIDNIGTPGGSVNNPEFIRVNTDAVGWDYAGRGDAELH